jgi:hypothetical protein
MANNDNAQSNSPVHIIDVKRATPRPAEKSAPSRRNLTRKLFAKRNALALAAGLVIILAGMLLWANYGHSSSDSNANLVKEISKVTVLPAGETPVVTKVVDKQQANQPFLANAQNGDVVLVYFKAREAVLYRPSSHQVIETMAFEDFKGDCPDLGDGINIGLTWQEKLELAGPAPVEQVPVVPAPRQETLQELASTALANA